jgi:hypothetical protein
MVTTRRSSFGIQDGDSLALRSRSVPASTDNTPSSKRKEGGMDVRSSSRKKRKSYGDDGADDAVVEQTQEIAPALNEDGGSLAEPASGSAREAQVAPGPGRLYGSEAGLQEPKSWLEDDFVPLSSETPLKQHSNAKQSEGVAEAVEQAASTDGPSVDEFDQDAASPNTENNFQSKGRLNHKSGDASQGLNEGADQKRVVQAPTHNVHKRFGSEEPVPLEEEVATIELQEVEQDAGGANGKHDGASSDDDEPEVVGSKLISRGIRPAVKAPKRTKRKAKPSTLVVNKHATPAEAERAPAEEDPFFVDSRAVQVSTNTPDLPLTTPESQSNQTGTTASHQPPKKRKLVNGSEMKPKDIIKDGVTYRTVSEPQPIVLALKRRGTSYLPPKSNTNSWRLRKQVLGRKRVQHVWGGRSAFLRTS